MAQYYTKNGSIPTTKKDNSPGWFAAPDKPIAPEGSEVVWWYPPGWVVRPIKPVKEGFDYSWNQSEKCWVEHAVVDEVLAAEAANNTIIISDISAEPITLSSAETTISLDLGTGSDTVTGSATPTI